MRPGPEHDTLRSEINQCITWVRRELIEAECWRTITIMPPPITGGYVHSNVDLLNTMFDPPYGNGHEIFSMIIDMIDQTIGVLLQGPQQKVGRIEIETGFRKGYAFIAMPIRGSDDPSEDVLDTIIATCTELGIYVERIDQVESNEKITDRILDSIRNSEFVIVDLTDNRPNVFYEAGFAQGIGRTPIYIAKEGNKLEFDIKDFPIIFYTTNRSLKEKLKRRLEALTREKNSSS